VRGLPDLANGKGWTYVYMYICRWVAPRGSDNKGDRVNEGITFDERANVESL